MKKFLGVLALVAAIGVQNTSFAVTAVAEEVIVQNGVAAVRIAQEMFAKNLTDASSLVGKEIGGVVLTQQAAQQLGVLASPLLAALKSNPSFKPTAADFDRLAELANSSRMINSATLEVMANSIIKSKGIGSVEADLALAKSENVANLLPSEVNAMNPTTVLETYSPITEMGRAALAQPAMTAGAEEARARLIQEAIATGAAVCEGNTGACVRSNLQVAEGIIANNLEVTGHQAFISDLFRGFPSEANRAPVSQYRAGGYNALALMHQDGSQQDPSLKPLRSCFLTGAPAAAGTN